MFLPLVVEKTTIWKQKQVLCWVRFPEIKMYSFTDLCSFLSSSITFQNWINCELLYPKWASSKFCLALEEFFYLWNFAMKFLFLFKKFVAWIDPIWCWSAWNYCDVGKLKGLLYFDFVIIANKLLMKACMP